MMLKIILCGYTQSSFSGHQIEDLVQFCCHLVEEQLIDEEAGFIDGTKIEANAN